ncbi:MAG: TSUP family transporter [Bdellovibrionota bacterium]
MQSVIGKSVTEVQDVFASILSLSTLKTDGSQFDLLIEDGQTLQAGSIHIQAIHTPGHTPTCTSYHIDDMLFTGDTLFMPDFGTGRCDFPKGSAKDLYHSVHEKLYTLPDQTRVFVGHDYQPNGRALAWETTIADSKNHNIHLKADTTEASLFLSAKNATKPSMRHGYCCQVFKSMLMAVFSRKKCTRHSLFKNPHQPEIIMISLLGYLAAVAIGFILGLLGAGGSILSVPVFVYVFDIPASIASGYSLFIVGSLAVFGSVAYYRRGSVNMPLALMFAFPSLIGVYTSRRWIVPSLPDIILQSPITLSKDRLILIVFGFLMLMASVFMVRKPTYKQSNQSENLLTRIWFIVQSFLVGILTGFVGAGGGFMIVPALVLLKKIDMKLAIGTSLMIVSINSLIGFIGDIQTNPTIQWRFLLIFWALAVIGLFGGTLTSKIIPGSKLKPLFGYFVLLIALGMLAKELFLHT